MTSSSTLKKAILVPFERAYPSNYNVEKEFGPWLIRRARLDPPPLIVLAREATFAQKTADPLCLYVYHASDEKQAQDSKRLLSHFEEAMTRFPSAAKGQVRFVMLLRSTWTDTLRRADVAALDPIRTWCGAHVFEVFRSADDKLSLTPPGEVSVNPRNNLVADVRAWHRRPIAATAEEDPSVALWQEGERDIVLSKSRNESDLLLLAVLHRKNTSGTEAEIEFVLSRPRFERIAEAVFARFGVTRGTIKFVTE